MQLQWASSLSIDVETGRVAVEQNRSELFRLRMNWRYLVAAEDGQIVGSRLSYSDQRQLWALEETADGAVRIKHWASGKYAEPENGSREPGAKIVLGDKADHRRQEWNVLKLVETV